MEKNIEYLKGVSLPKTSHRIIIVRTFNKLYLMKLSLQKALIKLYFTELSSYKQY